VNAPSLSSRELELITAVFRRHPEVQVAKLFGSRAKGTHAAGSDVDIALWGDVDELRAEAIAGELDELSLPYQFEVKSFPHTQLPALREHIERVGVVLYAKER
jgi:uncharacterized protein